VRFEVRAPFVTAGYCHCHRCQRRTGTGSSANARVPAEAFAIVAGAEAIRTWRPDGGMPKSFCGECGGALYSGDLERDALIGVRLGTLDADPGIELTWRQWVSSAATWEPIPQDGIAHHPGPRVDSAT
jgi:hypothetical protein